MEEDNEVLITVKISGYKDRKLVPNVMFNLGICVNLSILDRVAVKRIDKAKVMRKKPDFETTPWPTISHGAKDFVKKLLVKEPRARLTAAQALSHSWVREGGEASEIPIDISVLENMRQFVKFSRLKQIALKALATADDEDELDDLRDQFDAIDIDKNGSISLEEMRQALAKMVYRLDVICILNTEEHLGMFSPNMLGVLQY